MLQLQGIITQLGIFEMENSAIEFILELKPNGKVRLCLESAKLNQAPIQSVHRSPTLNDMFPKNQCKILITYGYKLKVS